MQFEECKNKLFSCKHCLRGTYTMYEYEKPKYKPLNRPLNPLPTPPHTCSSPVFPPLWVSTLVSAPQFPVSPSNLTKPRPQDGPSPCALTRQTPPPFSQEGSFSAASHGELSGQSFLGLNPTLTAQDGPRFRSFTMFTSFLSVPENTVSCLPELCQTPEWCFSKAKRASTAFEKAQSFRSKQGPLPNLRCSCSSPRWWTEVFTNFRGGLGNAKVFVGLQLLYLVALDW